MIDLSRYSERISDLTGMQSSSTDSDIIEFICKEEYYTAIPEPIPANKVLPDWYRDLEGKLDGDIGLRESSVKRCMPFLDALSLGWIIPLPGEVEIHYDEETKQYDYEDDFEEPLLGSHGPDQIGGVSNEMSQFPILKFHNMWHIKVPEGYSLLITDPINRYEPRFKTFSGVVDADMYFNTINFPFLWTGGSFDGVLDVGTPMVQVIPFKRDTLLSDARVRPFEGDEQIEAKREQVRLSSEESHYRNNLWQAKPGSRNLPPERFEKDESEESSGCPFHR